MTNTLSCYWSPWHRFPQYLNYIARLQPAWIRHHQPQAGDLSDAQRVSPQSEIMLRSWDIDDSNGERKHELYNNPLRAAAQLVDAWAAKADALEAELRSRNLPYDRSRWHFGAWNEPDPAYIPQIVAGNAEAMRLAAQRGMRLGVVCAPVGNYAKPEESPNGWTAFRPLEQPIKDGGHILIVHEYWQKEGPAGVWTDAQGNVRRDAGNLAWRHRIIPLDVPLLIGEAGANGYIFNRFSNADDCGWKGLGLAPAQFAAQVSEYISGCDSRTQGVCLYMHDFHDEKWGSFDTLEAGEALLAIKDVRPLAANPYAQIEPIITISLPIIETGGGAVQPETPSGIVDPLVAQAIIAIESGGQSFGPDGRVLIRFEAHIFKAQLGNDVAFTQRFRYGTPQWTGQEMRIDGDWQPIHTGAQVSEWRAYEMARSLNLEAAAKSISMGAPQAMGFNHARLGYPSAQAMLHAFESAPAQMVAFLNFLLSDTTLWAAVKAHDWREVARRYNGDGAVETYAALLQNAYESL